MVPRGKESHYNITLFHYAKTMKKSIMKNELRPKLSHREVYVPAFRTRSIQARVAWIDRVPIQYKDAVTRNLADYALPSKQLKIET